MTVAWVIGSHGLLGAALCRSLQRHGTALFSPAQRLRWSDPAELSRQLSAAVRAFASRVDAASGWEIYWAAGIGTMHSTPDELATETEAFGHLLSLVGSAAPLRAKPGAFGLASSAGAIYAGSTDFIISEASAPAPTTAYAYRKLAQEAILRALADEAPELTVLAARFSTLYGTQASEKKQGLLAYVARCIVRGEPVHVYVPLDTMRDYIAAEDAADEMIGALRRPSGRGDGAGMRIIASESSATISEILAAFRRVSLRSPRIVTSMSAATRVYSRLTQFRSIAEGRHSSTRRLPLLVGIAQLLEAERQRFVRGR